MDTVQVKLRRIQLEKSFLDELSIKKLWMGYNF